MMKHVQLSPYRSRVDTDTDTDRDTDTVSLSSNVSFASLNLSPETFTASRSSSYTSLNDQQQQQQQIRQGHHTNKITIKIYAQCLRSDIEYKTLSITYESSCREVVDMLLSKYRMRHRDPRLFYLSMEVTVRTAGVRTRIALDDDAKPAVLQSCHPRGDSRFSLQMRRGGLVKVHDSLLNTHSKYKSLLISTRTTCDELIALLLSCSLTTSSTTSTTTPSTTTTTTNVKYYSIYEVCPAREQQRKLHPDDKPLLVQQTWPTSNSCYFLIRRNPDFRQLTRRKFPPINTEATTTCYNTNNDINGRQSRIRIEDKRNKFQTNINDTKYSDLNQSYADYENYFYI